MREEEKEGKDHSEEGRRSREEERERQIETAGMIKIEHDQGEDQAVSVATASPYMGGRVSRTPRLVLKNDKRCAKNLFVIKSC